MKSKYNKWGLRVLLSILIWNSFLGCSVNKQNTASATPASITYQTFYDDLSPFGTWIDYPGYSHVWCPDAGVDFRPYSSNGHWVYSYEGWAWVSGYSWGWAPFHFGRWMYDDMYGWLWVPGYEWSPAWVTWGSVDDYYCWAPLTPGVNVNLSYNSWRPHSIYWNYCNRNHIYSTHLNQYIERPQNEANISNRITIINNYNTTNEHKNYYAKGPSVQEVEKYTKETIEPVTIKTVNKIPEVKNIPEKSNNNISNGNNSGGTKKGEVNITDNNSGKESDGNKVLTNKEVVPFYRPRVVQPSVESNQTKLRPKAYSRIENNNIRPVLEINDKPEGPRHEQIENVQRLPRVFRSQQSTRSPGKKGE